MSYNELRQKGLALDYSQLNDGCFVEVWEFNGSIYHCIWGSGNTSEFPSTIKKL